MQTNVRAGVLPKECGEDLTAKNSYLAVLQSDGTVKLPTAITDIPYGVITDGRAAGVKGDIQPLNPNQQIRVKLKGTCNPGDRIVLADPATPADAGKCRALPAAAGTYRVFALADEPGEDGQELLLRPRDLGNVTV